MTHLLRSVFLPFFLLLLVGCTSKPIYNATEDFASNMEISEQQMQQAIVSALNSRKWTVQSIKPGLVQAEITVRGRHHAEVDIPYSSTQFQILYRDSWGLDHHDGKVHRNYNRWVYILRTSVIKELGIDPAQDILEDMGFIAQQENESPTYLNFAEGVQHAARNGLVDGSVKFYLAGQPVTGITQKLNTVTSNRKTNASNKSDEDACLLALQSVLANLQNAAKKAGANAVIDIASYDDRSFYKNASRYQCWSGNLLARVALKGSLANVEQPASHAGR